MPPRTTYGRSGNPGSTYGVGASRQPNIGYGRPSSTTQVRITITWEPAARVYKVVVPYDENFIEFIKAKIPGNKRAWDGSQKCWFVDEDVINVLVVLGTELWTADAVVFHSREEVEKAEREQREAQRQAVLNALPPRERAAMEFIELCTTDALKAAYRKAALELHPDRASGDAERMTKLNAAWAALEKELSQK